MELASQRPGRETAEHGAARRLREQRAVVAER